MSEQVKIQLVGGPRDGQWVEDCGPIYREPLPRQHAARYVPSVQVLMEAPGIESREYVKERWADKWGNHPERYVARDYDLGQPSFSRPDKTS